MKCFGTIFGIWTYWQESYAKLIKKKKKKEDLNLFNNLTKQIRF